MSLWTIEPAVIAEPAVTIIVLKPFELFAAIVATAVSSSFIAVALATTTIAAAIALLQTMGAFWQRLSVARWCLVVQSQEEASLHFMTISSAGY